MASFPWQPGQAGTRKDSNEAVASAGLYANNLHLTPDRQPYLTAQFL